MASSREENPYEGGTGGKFRKRPLKRSQPTPYDRPPTVLRNASRNTWLSKLVDPAQRLIASSAQMFFSTVFRKRLPPPPAPPPPPLTPVAEDEKDLRNMDNKATSTDPVAVAGTIHLSDSASDKIDEYGVTELEHILKQKTFTRSEIDRLTSLLHSRTIEKPSGNEEKRFQLPSSAVVEPHLKEEFLKNSSPEDRLRSHAVSTPLMTSRVKINGLDDDVASPAEIAKAYTESRSSKVSPLILGSQTSGYMVESALASRHPFHSKTSVTPLVPSSPGNAIVSGNDFMTPRSRGRSAIYTMARTPYSRVHGMPAIKNMASTQDYSGPSSSSSQSAWEQDNTLGSKQGVLKRRSSALDKDIGSVGPIRRIRQKPNLISTKGLLSPAYGRPISMTETGVGSEAAHYFQTSNVHPSSYSVRKSLLSGGPVDTLVERSKENGDSALPSTSIPAIPSKSREMASKILEQIDKLTPPKEKSSELKVFGSRDKVPTKLSPSMLRGQALKSLEEVDSSKYLENLQDNKWLSNSLEISVPDSQKFSSKNQDNAEQNGSVKSLFRSDKSTYIADGLGSNALNKNITPNLMSVSSAGNSVLHPSQKKRAFQMSAHEDYLDFDDEVYSNGPTTDPLAGSDKKAGGTLTEKVFAKEAIIAEKPQHSSEVTSTVFMTDQKSDLKSSEDSVVSGSISSFIFPASHSVSVQAANPMLSVDQNVTEKELRASGPVFSFGANLSPNKEVTATPAPIFSLADKVTSFKEQSGPPVLTFEDNVVATKRPNTLSPVFNFGDKVDNSMDMKLATNNGEKFSLPKFNFASSSLLGESDSLKAGASSASKAEGSDNSLVAVSANSFNAKEPVSDKVDNKIISNFGSVSWTSGNAMMNPSSTSANVSSSFTFSSAGGNSNLVNGSLTSSTSYFPSSTPPVVFGNNKVTQSLSDTPFVTPATNNSVATNTVSITTAATSTFTTPNISFSTSASSSSFPAAPIFKFGAPTPAPAPAPAPAPSPSPSPAPTPAVSATTGTESVDAKSKQETSLSNINHASLSGASASILPNGSSIFGFHAGTTSTGNKELQASGAGSGSMFGAPLSVSGTGVAASTLSIPIQFGSSSASPSFGLAGNQASSGSSLFGSTASTTKLFNSSSTFGLVSSTSSSEANTVGGSGSSTNSLVFGASWQPSTSPVFGSTFTSASQAGFSFGSNSSGASMVFGSSTGAGFSFGSNSSPAALTSSSTGAGFSFGSNSSPAALTSSHPVFGNPSPAAFAFGSTSPGMSDQMNMEDSMAEDTVNMSNPTIPSFGQQPISPSPTGFVFGSTPSAANPFQFGGQQNPGTPQSSPFQASGSLNFNASAGGSFSLGTVGGDKANRKFVKVKHKQRKK